MEGITFEKAIFDCVDFSGVDLTRASLSGLTISRCFFVLGNLSGMDLSGCNLSNCDFTSCNLERTRLDGAILANANFKGANLRQASLAGAMAKAAFFGEGVLAGAGADAGDAPQCDRS